MGCVKNELMQGNTVSIPRVDFSAIAAMFAGVMACAVPASVSNGTYLSQGGASNVPAIFKKASSSKSLSAEIEARSWLSSTSRHLRELAFAIETDLEIDLSNLMLGVRSLVDSVEFEEASIDSSTYENGLATLASIERSIKIIESVVDSVRLFEKTSLEIFPYELSKKDFRAMGVVFNYYEKMLAFKHEFKLLINQAKTVDVNDFGNFDLSENWDAEIENIANATVEHFSLSSVA